MNLLDAQFKKALLFTSVTAVLFLSAALGSFFWNLQPVDSADQAKISFTVSKGEGPAKIAERLKEAGLIRSPNAFIFYVSVTGQRSKLQVGTYSFQPAFSTQKIAGMLAGGEVDSSRVVIAEGFRLTQITSAVEKAGIKNFQEGLSKKYDYDFLNTRPSGQGLEGYLFPDTYNVARDAAAEDVVKLMLENFSRRVTPNLRDRIQQGGRFNLHQAITLASIVERESGRPEDMPTIAQVFLRRLQIGMKLDSDVTVQYAAGLEANQQAETAAAIQSLNSPYNTYKVAGLPPGPICSPGLAAMEAVANPASTDYLYFVADHQGVTHFARTFEEHQANIRKYR
jgi:uncharacterized YceG family protein